MERMEARAQRAEQLQLEIQDLRDDIQTVHAKLQTKRTTLHQKQKELGEIKRLQEVEERTAKWTRAVAAHGRPPDWATLLKDLLPTVMEVWQAAGQEAWGEPKTGRGFSKAVAVVREVCAGWQAVHDTSVKRLMFKRRMTDEAVDILVRRFPAVTSVQLMGKDRTFHMVTDQAVLTVCSQLPALKTLELSCCLQFTSVGLLAVSKMSALTSLELTFSMIGPGASPPTEEAMTAVSRMPALTHLNLTRVLWQATSLEYEPVQRMMRAVSKMRSLTSLDLRDCGLVKSEGLLAVSSLPALTYLNLTDIGVLDKELIAVSRMTSLTALDLTGCVNRQDHPATATDKAMLAVSQMPALRSLNLGKCWSITNAGFQAVSKMSLLTSLRLGWCNFNHQVVKAVGRMPALTHLDLRCCEAINDASLRHLRPLQTLTLLQLFYCNTSHKAENELCQRIPGLAIERELD